MSRGMYGKNHDNILNILCYEQNLTRNILFIFGFGGPWPEKNSTVPLHKKMKASFPEK